MATRCVIASRPLGGCTIETNSSHFVPRSLMKGWEIPTARGFAWAYRQKTFAKVRFDDVCCLPSRKEWNDAWAREVEQRAFGALRSLRIAKRPATPGNVVFPFKGLDATAEAGLLHLVFSFRARHPDTPAAWGGVREDEYLSLLLDPDASAMFIEDLRQRYAVFRVWRSEGSTPLVLTDMVVFPLAMMLGVPVFFVPVGPDVGMILAARQLKAARVQADLAGLDLGAISEGAPAVLRLLDPRIDWPDSRVQEAAAVRIKANILKYRPAITSVGRTGP